MISPWPQRGQFLFLQVEACLLPSTSLCYREPMVAPRIAVVGDHDPQRSSHAALDEALGHVPFGITASWIATDELAHLPERMAEVDGLWIAPGSPYRSFEGALRAIRYACERNVPLVAT